jgi:putative inorganic carbon (HCO3(-)) transporter
MPLGHAVGWGLVAAGLLLVGALIALLLPLEYVIAGLAGVLIVSLWWVAPEPVLLTLLLFRSSVDAVMDAFVLAPGSPLSMNLSGAANSLVVGLGALCLVRRFYEHKPLLPAPPARALTLFLGAALLSIPGAPSAPEAIKAWARHASLLAVYVLVVDAFSNEAQARRAVRVILLSSLVPVALALVQFATGRGYFFLGDVGTVFAFRPQGTLAHPSILGNYLILVASLAMAYWLSTPRPLDVSRLLVGGWIGITGLTVLATFARAQWAGAALATLVVAAARRRWALLLALLLLAAAVLSLPIVQTRLAASHSIGWRQELWGAGLSLVTPPPLVGLGIGTAHWHTNQLLPGVDSPPHNDYLKALIETGLLGLVAHLLTLALLVRHGWRAYRHAASPAIRWRGLALLAVAMAGVAISVVDNYLEATAAQWYIWALVALVPPVRSHAAPPSTPSAEHGKAA